MPGQPTLRYRILRKIALDDADGRMVFLTAVIALTGLVGIILVILGGRDTSRLVTAAEKQAAAARKSADAAKSFADTAEQISKGISEAVDKLKVQASANQNLASAAKIANANTLEADRPWIGVFLQVSDFALGKTPTYSVVFTNSGKRPARITLTQTMSVPHDYGANPVYKPFETTPSTTLIVPGQAGEASWKDGGAMSPISDELMKSLTSGELPFRVYVRIEYTDVRTNAHYWTHACWRFDPTYTPANGGFNNCPEYNDTR